MLSFIDVQVKMLVRELLKVLDTADDDVKNELTQKLCLVIEKYEFFAILS